MSDFCILSQDLIAISVTFFSCWLTNSQDKTLSLTFINQTKGSDAVPRCH